MINIDPKVILKYLLIAVLFFISASLLGHLYVFYFNEGQRRFITFMFDMDEEFNFPAYFSSFILAASSMLLLIIAVITKQNKQRYAFHWGLLGIIFLYLSMDEILRLHEQTASHFRYLLNTSGIFYFAWVIPAMIILFVLFIIYIGFLNNLQKPFAKYFIVCGIIFVTGALGF